MHKQIEERLCAKPEFHDPWKQRLEEAARGERELEGYLIQLLAELSRGDINVLRWDRGELLCRHYNCRFGGALTTKVG